MSPRRILAFGLYQKNYPRNVLTQKGLQKMGCAVRTLNVPVWESMKDRLEPARRLPSLIRLGLKMAGAYVALVLRGIRESQHTDAVLFGYPGHMDVVVFGPFFKLFKKKVIYDPLITLTDTLVEDRRLVHPSSWKAKVLRWIDTTGLRIADVVLVDTEENAQYIQELGGIPSDKTVVVPVGADEEVFSPQNARESAEHLWEMAPPGSLKVLFYGSYIPLQGPEIIVRAAAILRERAFFVMIGRGQLSNQCIDLANDLRLENITFIPWVEYEALPSWIASADVVLGIFGNTPKAARVVPNKVFQAMAMGAPIVTRDSPPIRRVLEDGVSAILVPPGDPQALAEGIEKLQDIDLRRALGQAAIQSFQRYGSLEAIANRLRTVCDRIAG